MKFLVLSLIFFAMPALAAKRTDVICRSAKSTVQGNFDIKIVTDDPHGGHPDTWISYGYSTWEQSVEDQVWASKKPGTSVLTYVSENFPGGTSLRLDIKLQSARLPVSGFGKFYVNKQNPIDLRCRVFAY